MLTEQAREKMVEQQVRTWTVLDERVLDVLRSVPREHFVPPQYQYLAFADVDVPLPKGQHMLRPNVTGRLMQSLQLTGSERVLEVGAGSGFVTACLAACTAHVHAVEIFPELADLARERLSALRVGNAEITTADALQLDPGTRYDAIAVTGSMPVYDDRLEKLLAVGGRMFVVVGEPPVMEARLVRRASEDGWVSESLFETVIDPLVNARRHEKFTF